MCFKSEVYQKWFDFAVSPLYSEWLHLLGDTELVIAAIFLDCSSEKSERDVNYKNTFRAWDKSESMTLDACESETLAERQIQVSA
jgi:hypothetical protein